MLDERLAAVTAAPASKTKGKVKEKKVKPPKAVKIKAPKPPKPEKVKAPKVEPRAAEPPGVVLQPFATPSVELQRADATTIGSQRVEAPSIAPQPVEAPMVDAAKLTAVKVEKPKLEKRKVEKSKVEKPKPVVRAPFTPDPNATLVYVHTVSFGFRTIPLELWSDHIKLGGRNIEWGSIRAVTARAGRVWVDTGDKKTTVSFAPAVDGVPEPELAAVFAEIVLDASSGAPPREKLLRTLADGKADTKYRFRERDDQTVPPLVILITILAAALLAVLVPGLVALPFRGGPNVGADNFLIYPRLSSIDPRSIIAAVAGGLILSRAAMRAAAGRDLMLWAGGTAAGWNSGKGLRLRVLRAVAAHMLLHTRAYAIAVAIALLVFLPSARERVAVDTDGVHIRSGLPFFDRDVPWSDVAEPVLINERGTYDVVLATTGGLLGPTTLVDTRGSVFYGLSPYELGQFAERRRAAASP